MSENGVADNIVSIDKNIREDLKKVDHPVLTPEPPKITIEKNCLMDVLSHEGLFSAKECAAIRDLFPAKWEPAVVAKKNADDPSPLRREDYRNNSNYMIMPDEDRYWVFEKLLSIVHAANKIYKFDINQFNAVQLSRYQVGEFYKTHVDIGPGVLGNRKISLTLQITDPSKYEGGDLVLDVDDFHASRELGSVTLFPSFIKHWVTPVTKGTRYSLVAWISGEYRFR